MTTFTREDFEHAARAAGLTIESMALPYGAVCSGLDRFWNPPTDDGDALRLAVKLGLAVLTNVNNSAHVFERCLGTCGSHQVGFGTAGDEFAATRHAIFCAAIAIGKATP